jgi:hypothetical protein
MVENKLKELAYCLVRSKIDNFSYRDLSHKQAQVWTSGLYRDMVTGIWRAL